MRIAIRNLEIEDFGTLWSMDWYPLLKERDTIYLEICQQQREFSFVAEHDDHHLARITELLALADGGGAR